MKILVTGGAGFVGHSLIRHLKETLKAEITAFDNLHRRGSENNLASLKKLGVKFVQGDVRCKADFDALDGDYDLIIDAAAEPSVLSGINGDTSYCIQTNLFGTINLLDFAKTRGKKLIFLSTSRVYSIDPLKEIKLTEGKTRFELSKTQTVEGITAEGINEFFPCEQSRSLYGATKLCSEYLIQEYASLFGVSAIINRCGVICGPGQFGKVDQGVFTLWMMNHYFHRPLQYTGFGGTGKQIRDLLHPTDLGNLFTKQIKNFDSLAGETFNVGGGQSNAISLCELTQICEKITGHKIEIKSKKESANFDIPFYVTDNSKIQKKLDWKPGISVESTMRDIYGWIKANEWMVKEL